jgi:hypothetical protein
MSTLTRDVRTRLRPSLWIESLPVGGGRVLPVRRAAGRNECHIRRLGVFEDGVLPVALLGAPSQRPAGHADWVIRGMKA